MNLNDFGLLTADQNRKYWLPGASDSTHKSTAKFFINFSKEKYQNDFVIDAPYWILWNTSWKMLVLVFLSLALSNERKSVWRKKKLSSYYQVAKPNLT